MKNCNSIHPPPQMQSWQMRFRLGLNKMIPGGDWHPGQGTTQCTGINISIISLLRIADDWNPAQPVEDVKNISNHFASLLKSQIVQGLSMMGWSFQGLPTFNYSKLVEQKALVLKQIMRAWVKHGSSRVQPLSFQGAELYYGTPLVVSCFFKQ